MSQPTASDMVWRGWVVLSAAEGRKDPARGSDEPGLTLDWLDKLDRFHPDRPRRYSVIIGSKKVGFRSGIVDFETDGPEGEVALLEACGGNIPAGPKMVTPSGSVHRIFAAPDIPEGQRLSLSRGKLPKVDVMWQFLALDEDKRVWSDWDLVPPPLPPALRDLILPADRTFEQGSYVGDGVDAWGAAALRDEAEKLATIGDGEDRGHALYLAGNRMASRRAHVDLDEARDALMAAAWDNGSCDKYGEDDMLRQLENGIRDGLDRPEDGPKPPGITRVSRAELLGDETLAESFWTARPELEHIRQAAHARMVAPGAVLHAVLARIAAGTPYTYRLPAIVGDSGTLSYFAATVAPPGVGKSAANGVAKAVLPLGEYVADGLPIGSGEGLVEVLFDVETDDKGKKVKRQVRHNAYVYVDEGQMIGNIGKRDGSALLPTMRSIWSGGAIGQTNASTERKRIVPAGRYVFGISVSVQPEHAEALLGDAGGGLPQRFGWARATDPSIPDTLPEWPGELPWKPPSLGLDDVLATATRELDVADSIQAEIKAHRLDVVRGAAVSEALDAHADLYRLKVAGLLALLARRTSITEDDWRLAGVIRDASNEVRDGLVAGLAEQGERREQALVTRLQNRAVAQATAVEQQRVQDCAVKMSQKVNTAGETTVRQMRHAMKHYRPVFDVGLDHAMSLGWIAEDLAAGQGEAKRVLRPGPVRVP